MLGNGPAWFGGGPRGKGVPTTETTSPCGLSCPPRRRHRADPQPVPAGSVAPRAGAGRTRTTTRWSRTATSGSGCTGRRCRRRIPRSVPDEEFNEIFARLPSHRDRALVAFYVSTGARASELLSVTQGGVDPGRQLITVVRKGAARCAAAPGVDRRVRLVAALPGGDGRADPARAPAAVVVDAAASGPAADLSRGAPHVRAGQRPGGHRGDAALVAAHRRLPDGRGPGAAADRRAVRAGSRPADHHPDLPDPAQGGRDPPGAGPPRRADPAGRRAGRSAAGAGLPARDAGRAVRDRTP